MGTLRPRSLSGLLSAALLLIVLPLTAAVVYSGVQMRKMSRASDALVRDSVELTQQTQVLFQIITLMERSARYYVVLEDPRLAAAFNTNQRAFNETLDSLAERASDAQLERVVPPAARARASPSARSAAIAREPGRPLDVLASRRACSPTRRARTSTAPSVVERARAGDAEWLCVDHGARDRLASLARSSRIRARPLRALDRAISDLGRAHSRGNRDSGPGTWPRSDASSNGCARACSRLRSSATVSCATCRTN